MARTSGLACSLLLAAVACAAPPSERVARSEPVRREVAANETLDVIPEQPPPQRVDAKGTYLQPNVRDQDGVAGYIHVTASDMPLRVAVGSPRVPPRYGSRADARRVAIEAMQLWEAAIRPHAPWFRLEFAEEDPSAPVQVIWKNRIAGPWGGFGGLRYEIEDGRLRVGGQMQVSTTPTGDTGLEVRVKLDEIRLLVAHEFGHVLGLGHCLDCDSAMNYSWDTLGRVVVTELDARTFAALVAQPNGRRVDGQTLSFLPEPGR